LQVLFIVRQARSPMKPPYNIVCLSSQRWDDGMWTNKQHVMSRLAQRHRVVHVNHGLNPLPTYLYRHLKDAPADLLSPSRLLTQGVRQREEGLFIGDGFAPFFTGLFSHGSNFRDYWTFQFKVNQVRRYLQAESIDDKIAWVYHPGFGDAVDAIDADMLVYDCVDNYAEFPHLADDPAWLIERERRLCKKADVVFTTASNLQERLEPYNPEHTHLVHNVGDAPHFKRALDPDMPVADELAELDGPVIGFVGAVSDYKLNQEWILALARQRPDWQIVLIGPTGIGESGTDVGELQRQSNVHLLGHRDYEDLPRYLKGFDVATIPYRINEYTRSCFPIKFFEYMASGTPVVISALPALEEHYDLAHVAHDTDGFVEACENALEQGGDGREERLERAEANSWETKIDEMMSIVEARMEELGLD